MAIARVQAVANHGDDVASVAVTISSASANNLLLTFAAANENAGDVTFTTPTGFTALPQGDINFSGRLVGAIWYKVAAGGETSVSVSISAARDLAVVVCEYSGAETSGVLDKEAENSGGPNTTADSGTTATTTVAGELWAAFTATQGDPAQSLPTNGFAEVTNKATTNGASNLKRVRIYMWEKIVSATGAANVSATIGSSVRWIGQVATFKESGGAPPATGKPRRPVAVGQAVRRASLW